MTVFELQNLFSWKTTCRRLAMESEKWSDLNFIFSFFCSTPVYGERKARVAQKVVLIWSQLVAELIWQRDQKSVKNRKEFILTVTVRLKLVGLDTSDDFFSQNFRNMCTVIRSSICLIYDFIRSFLQMHVSSGQRHEHRTDYNSICAVGSHSFLKRSKWSKRSGECTRFRIQFAPAVCLSADGRYRDKKRMAKHISHTREDEINIEIALQFNWNRMSHTNSLQLEIRSHPDTAIETIFVRIVLRQKKIDTFVAAETSLSVFSFRCLVSSIHSNNFSCHGQPMSGSCALTTFITIDLVK